MLATRIIPCLDIKDGSLTKGIKFKGNKKVGSGNALLFARKYSRAGADELIFYDISATPKGKNINRKLLARIAREINIPFSVGGGIRSLEDMREVLALGAEKVSINSAAVKNPLLIKQGAKAFGSQCTVLGIDALKNSRMPSGYEIYIAGGRKATGIDVLKWVKKAEKLGIGEIVANSIDEDGMKQGYDLVLLRKLKKAVKVPVIASGGAGSLKDLYEGIVKGKADGVLVASMLHFNEFNIKQIKNYLSKKKIVVRK